MSKHVTILAGLLIAYSIMGLIGATITFISIAGGGLLSGEAEAIAITATVGSIIASIMVLLSLPGLIAGIALLGMRPWARYVIIVLGFLNLLAIPFGTALGIYTIWVLLKDETAQLFSPA